MRHRVDEGLGEPVKRILGQASVADRKSLFGKRRAVRGLEGRGERRTVEHPHFDAEPVGWCADRGGASDCGA